MTASGVAAPSGARSAQDIALKIIGAIVVALLAYQAVHFFVRDPLHYVVDYSTTSYGRFWPRRLVLLPHIVGGTLALFSGPFQLWSGLRRRHLRIHRMFGYTYITGVAIAGGSAFYLAFHADPPVSGIPLFAMAAAWWTTVAMAFIAIRRMQIDAHRQWMIRGYVITFAFVTVRYVSDLPILAPLGDERFVLAAWMCWTIPLFITEVLLQWRKTVGVRRLAPNAISKG